MRTQRSLRESDAEFLEKCRLNQHDDRTQALAINIRRALEDHAGGSQEVWAGSPLQLDSVDVMALCLEFSEMLNEPVAPDVLLPLPGEREVIANVVVRRLVQIGRSGRV